MPIYEYYCPDNHTVYQFYAKTLAQGQRVPTCPANPRFRMQKMVSAFAIARGGAAEAPAEGRAGEPAEDARMDAAMDAMEREFEGVDENDPKAMARMMRRMAELGGDKLDEQAEEVVRKLEEGADPDSLEDQLGGVDADEPEAGAEKTEQKEPRHRFRARRALPPRRDPKLYDF